MVTDTKHAERIKEVEMLRELWCQDSLGEGYHKRKKDQNEIRSEIHLEGGF